MAGIAFQKADVVAVGNEADILAFRLVCIDEALFGGDRAHLGLAHAAERQQRARQLALRERIEHIALVFRRIGAAYEDESVVTAHDLRVVARRHIVAPQVERPFKHASELQSAIAVDARVRRARRFVRTYERLDDGVFETIGEIDRAMGYAQTARNALGILDVVQAAAGTARARARVAAGQVAAMQAHRGADDFVSLLFEHVRGNARIDASAHAHHDALRHRRTAPSPGRLLGLPRDASRAHAKAARASGRGGIEAA